MPALGSGRPLAWRASFRKDMQVRFLQSAWSGRLNTMKINLEKHLSRIREISSKEEKTRGYGGGPKKFVDPLMPRFRLITYKKGPYLVVDRYSGDEQFIGESITFYKKNPILGLNYYGKILDNNFKTDYVYDFLKQALRSGKSPYRGLDGFKKDKFLYKNKYTEKDGFVIGEEKIFLNKNKIYFLVYHGGLIEDRRSLSRWKKNLLTGKPKI